jgi:hypothetical protein
MSVTSPSLGLNFVFQSSQKSQPALQCLVISMLASIGRRWTRLETYLRVASIFSCRVSLRNDGSRVGSYAAYQTTAAG